MKLNVPAKDCKGIDIGGTRYDAHRGQVTVDNPAHARALLESECFAASATPRATGRTCTSCGFVTWFASCGRCGGATEKEHP